MNVLRTWTLGLLVPALVAWTSAAVHGADKPSQAKSTAPSGGHGSDAHGGAAHGAEEHGGDAHSDDTNPLSFDKDLAFWTLVIFLVLLAVLKKFAWGPIAEGLDRRERTISEHIAFAEQSQEEGRRLLAEYEAKLAAAQEEVRAIIEEGRRAAEQVHQEILAKARSEAEAEMNRAKREIETAKDQALISLAESAANHAVELAGKILGAKLDQAQHARLIEEALAGFPQGNAAQN
jgi:F-type H+-transporting ATPase subunit b